MEGKSVVTLKEEQVPEAVSALLRSSRSYVAGVDTLKGPLEADVREAASACWTIDERTIQVKSKFGLRSRNVKVHEPTFINEAETELLGAALHQWTATAEGAVAAAALEVRLAERRLQYGAARVLGAEPAQPARVLALLDALLAMVAAMGAATLISCGGLLHTIKNLALYVGQQYRQLASPPGGAPSGEAEKQLMEVVARHVGGAEWVAAIFQPPVQLLPQLLLALLDPKALLAEGETSQERGSLAPTAAMLAQFPFEQVESLTEGELTEGVISPLLAFAGHLADQREDGGSPDNEHVFTLILKALLLVAEAKRETAKQAHEALLLALKSFLCGTGLQDTKAGLGISGSTPEGGLGGVVVWAQGLWGEGPHPNAAAAARIIMTLDWQHLIPQLEGPTRLRALLLLLEVAGALQRGTSGDMAPYFACMWRLLGGEGGASGLGTGLLEDEAHIICMADAQGAGGQSPLVALWTCLRLNLATSLLEAWSRQPGSQAAGQAAALLEGMQFFLLLPDLVYADEPGTFPALLVRFVPAAARLGPVFHSCWVGPVASVVEQAALEGAPVLEAVKAHMDQVVANGVAAAKAEVGEEVAAEEGDLSTAASGPRAGSGRGSTPSPGAAALEAAEGWLPVLVACAAGGGLPATAAKLASDLTQLLYYHGGGASPALQDSPYMQGVQQAALTALGPERVLGLWPTLLRLTMDDPKSLQWLAVLATWLTAAATKSLDAQQELSSSEMAEATDGPKDGDGPGSGGNVEGHADAAAGVAPAAEDNSMAISVEEAIQLQEAAVRVGYAGAAFPLWEEVLERLFRWPEALKALLPCDDMAAHLQQLAQLYETPAPLLAETYVLLASLEPSSLSGGNPRAISGNPDIIRELMKLHPLSLGKSKRLRTAGGSTAPEAAPGDPVAVSRVSPIKRRPLAGAASFKTLVEEQARVVAEMKEVEETPIGKARPSGAGSSRRGSMDRSRSSGPRDLPAEGSSSLGLEGALSGAGMDDRDADLPDAFLQAQGVLWDATVVLEDRLRDIEAQMRELVCRRYRPADLRVLEAGEGGDADEVSPLEEPAYDQHFQSMRETALATVVEFAQGPALVEAAALLYRLEASLLAGKQAAQDEVATDADAQRRKTLYALLETMADGSAPATAMPYLTSLVQVAAPALLGPGPDAKVEAIRRLMAALAMAGQGRARKADAGTILRSCINPDRLLDEGKLDEYMIYVSEVLTPPPGVPASAVSHLLAIFDAPALVATLTSRDAPRLGAEALTTGSEEGAASGRATLELAMQAFGTPGGERFGAALFSALLGANPRVWYAACLQVALVGVSNRARPTALAALGNAAVGALPLRVINDCLDQVVVALNNGQLAPPAMPYALLKALLRSPCIIQELRSSIAGSAPPSPEQREGSGPSWSADVDLISAPPTVKLVQVGGSGDAVERIGQLLGACLQSILSTYGSGDLGAQLAGEVERVLGLIPVQENPWLVDYMWRSYCDTLQPFLLLAGPLSGGEADALFRQYWQDLPWRRATFHCENPGALAGLTSYLLLPDHAALDLLHRLDWQPLLQQLLPVLLPPSSLGAGLDPVARRWASNVAALALQAAVLLPPQALPAWLRRLIWTPTDGLADGQSSMEDSLGPLDLAGIEGGRDTDALQLSQIIAAADPDDLEALLCQEEDGVPFLMQPLVVMTAYIEGDPGERLLRVAHLLASAAERAGSARMAALAARAMQTFALASVCQGILADAGAGPTRREISGVPDCWHLNPPQFAEVVQQCLALAQRHSSLDVVVQLQMEVAASQAMDHGAMARGGASPLGTKWKAPNLAELTSRLAPSDGKVGAKLMSNPDGTSAQSSAPKGDKGGEKKEETPDVAALLRVLLHFVSGHPRCFLTLDPIPFANAEEPLSAPQPADGEKREEVGVEELPQEGTPIWALEEDKWDITPVPDSAVKQAERAISLGREQLAAMIGRAQVGARRVAQRLIRPDHPSQTAGPDRAAPGSLPGLRLQAAHIIREACEAGGVELPLCLLRVSLTAAPASRPRVLEALLEDLVLLVLIRQQSQPGRPGSAPHPIEEQGSGDSQTRGDQLMTVPLDDDTENSRLPPGRNAVELLLGAIEGLPDDLLSSICEEAAASHAPLLLALATEKLRLQAAAGGSTFWEPALSGTILRTGSVEGAARAPAHIIAAWLGVLPWLAEAAGKGGVDSGGLPVMPLQSLLASLQRHLLLLRTTGAPPEAGGGLLGDARLAGVLHVAAERVRALRQGLNAALERGEVPPALVAGQEGGRPSSEAQQPRGFRERLAPFVGGGPESQSGPQESSLTSGWVGVRHPNPRGRAFEEAAAAAEAEEGTEASQKEGVWRMLPRVVGKAGHHRKDSQDSLAGDEQPAPQRGTLWNMKGMLPGMKGHNEGAASEDAPSGAQWAPRLGDFGARLFKSSGADDVALPDEDTAPRSNLLGDLGSRLFQGDRRGQDPADAGAQQAGTEGPNLADRLRLGGLRSKLFKTGRAEESVEGLRDAAHIVDSRPSSAEAAPAMGKMKDRFRNLLQREEGDRAHVTAPAMEGGPATPRGGSKGTEPTSLQPSGAPPTAMGDVQKGNRVASRIADGLKKALGGGAGRKAAEADRIAAAAVELHGEVVAGDTLAALGLAAFAISAFIKTVLCPELATYTPRVDGSSQWGMDEEVPLPSTPTGFSWASPHTRAPPSPMHGGAGSRPPTPATPVLQHKVSVNSALIHEFDQVLAARGELDSLEEVLNSPLVAAHSERFAAFFDAAPHLLQPNTTVEVFASSLQGSLFPDAPYLASLLTHSGVGQAGYGA